MIELKQVTLEEIGGGVVPELFDHELGRVLANIDDPNTDASKPREIVVKVRFAPSADRESASVVVAVASKLVGVKPAVTSVFIGREGGRLVAFTRNPRQAELPLDGKVLEMKKKGGGE